MSVFRGPLEIKSVRLRYLMSAGADHRRFESATLARWIGRRRPFLPSSPHTWLDDAISAVRSLKSRSRTPVTGPLTPSHRNNEGPFPIDVRDLVLFTQPTAEIRRGWDLLTPCSSPTDLFERNTLPDRESNTRKSSTLGPAWIRRLHLMINQVR